MCIGMMVGMSSLSPSSWGSPASQVPHQLDTQSALQGRAAPKRSIGACDDLLPDCSQRSMEYCKQDPAARSNCRKRCGLCDDVPIIDQGSVASKYSIGTCDDLLPDCSQRPMEYCKQDPATRSKCKKHCGLCEHSPSLRAGASCLDTDAKMCSARHRNDIYCAFHEASRQSCRKTCNACDSHSEGSKLKSNSKLDRGPRAGRAETIGSVECFTGQQPLRSSGNEEVPLQKFQCTRLFGGKVRN